jgi:putative flippase GtrA
MSQTLPRVDEGPFESTAPSESTSASEKLQDRGVQTNHFFGTSPHAGVISGVRPAVVELAIPVYNEEGILEASVRRLRSYLDKSFPFETTILIVDNASTDGTWEIASRLAADLDGVSALHLDRKGRGLALRRAWSLSTAQIVAYMDVDLSTDLGGLLPLVAPLLSGHSDVTIGSRLASGARVVRGPKRELISRAYNLLLKLSVQGRFSDAQCGFKALRRESAQRLLPLVEDDEWFFDTEILVAAQRLGLRICEVPVDWVDDPDSRVKILRTAWSDVRGVWRISHGSGRRRDFSSSGTGPVVADPLLRFAGVGVVSTVAYVILFVLFRKALGDFGANALALGMCALFNLVVHKRLAHNMGGKAQRRRFAAVAGGLYVISLGLTSLALVAVHDTATSSLLLTLAAVTAANAVASTIRFAVLRAWIFRPSVGTVFIP